MVDIKTYFKRLQIVFSSFWGGLLVLFLASLFLIKASRHFEMDLFFIVTNSVLILICLLVAYLFSNKKISSAKIKRGLREKLADYKKALLIKWSVFEILGLYSILAYQVTDDEIFVCVSIFVLVLMLINRPNINMTCDNLDLDKQDEEVMKNPNSII